MTTQKITWTPEQLATLAESCRMLNIAQLARVCRNNWPRVYFGAVPYLQAMGTMDKITDMYGCDDGSSIVTYFLGNAATWRGPVAKVVKGELKRRLKGAR